MSRFGNIVIALVTLGVGYFLSGAHFSSVALLADCLAMVFAIAFGNIYNDVLDVEADKINRPERPLPAGEVSLKAAQITCVCCVALTLLLALLPGVSIGLHFIFYVSLLGFLFLYNRFLKKLPLVKNTVVAFLCTTPLVKAALLQGAEVQLIIPAVAFAFLLTLAREIEKDLEDSAGDMAAGILTFPAVVGQERAARLALILVAFVCFLLPLPVLSGIYPIAFLFLLLPLLILSVAIFKWTKKGNFRKAQKLCKLSMAIGLAFIIAVNI